MASASGSKWEQYHTDMKDYCIAVASEYCPEAIYFPMDVDELSIAIAIPIAGEEGSEVMKLFIGLLIQN